MSVRPPTEADIQAVCLAWLRAWGAFPVRVNSGAVKTADRYVRFNTEPGCSDSLVCLPDGRFAAIEFKRPGKKPTESQSAFLASVRRAGGLALVATGLDQLRGLLSEAGYNVSLRSLHNIRET